ncbi:MAG: hypothetical protein OEV85_00595 [Candidatus Thorarchaeota archaeon]|nr:hypothetical protein [Candidatus Thorarchaeota archaeon]
MNKKNEYRERLPIAKWPELERKMGIIARMTSDPPLKKLQKDTPELPETTDVFLTFLKSLTQSEKKISQG